MQPARSFRGRALLETGLGVDQYKVTLTPLGTAPYAIATGGTEGNYYLTQRTQARRWQHAYLFGFYWAIRGGFDNVTNHANVAVDNGTIDSQHPGSTYIDAPGRAFSFRCGSWAVSEW